MSNPFDPGSAKPGEAVTQTELRVIELIARGHSSQEAADRLLIGKRTVDEHLANLYRKLQVNNRVQAINALRRTGRLGHLVSQLPMAAKHSLLREIADAEGTVEGSMASSYWHNDRRKQVSLYWKENEQ